MNMECTQRIECTQELFSDSQRACPKQIGFLGICGSKYPLNKGPNKIGRDPETCDIVLDVNSISRHHAVINILSEKNIMLMDLGSSNKTMLLGAKLQPYIPHPLRNGDTIQFGQVFGIFRLLEDDDQLPLTQAVDIPETPLRQVSRMKIGQSTTIPESPDISDRDDSIIVHSQHNKSMTLKKTNNLMKSTEPNKINNLYWNSSKKSESFSSTFDENSSPGVKKSSVSPRKLSIVQNNIFDMETQAPVEMEKHITDSIYDAKTQIPSRKELSSIYNLETQLPNRENLPEVYKVKKQSNVQLNLYSTVNKKVDNNIFDAETQIENNEGSSGTSLQNKPTCESVSSKPCGIVNEPKPNLNTSDEEIHFDDFDSQPFEDICESQPLLMDACDIIQSDPVKISVDGDKDKISSVNASKDPILVTVTHSHDDDDDDTDCEDIFENKPSKSGRDFVKFNDAENKPKSVDDDDEDVTDFEDDIIEISQNTTKVSDPPYSPNKINDLPTQIIAVEDNQALFDELTQVIEECPPNENENSEGKKGNIEDLETQVIAYDNKQSNSKSPLVNKDGIFRIPHSASRFISSSNEINDLPTQELVVQQDQTNYAFEDQLTQVIENYSSNDVNAESKKDNIEDLETQVIGREEDQHGSNSTLMNNNELFKVPQISPRYKRKDITSLPKINSTGASINSDRKDEEENNYYNATQDIMLDLCTQKEPESRNPIRETASGDYDHTEKIERFVANLTKNQIRVVIGVDISPSSKKKSSDVSDIQEHYSKILGNNGESSSKGENQNQEIIHAEVIPISKKNSGNTSDLESTPKKFTPSKFLMINLPSSQDIKSCEFLCSQNSDSNSDPFEDTQDLQDVEESTSVVYRRKQKRDIKRNLVNKFDATALPTRAITRIRKPTSKILDSDESSRKMTEKILQSRLGLDNKVEMDGDVILSNLARLRKKAERAKNKVNNVQTKSDTDEVKLEKSSQSHESELSSELKTQERITKYFSKADDNNLKPDSKHSLTENKSTRSKSSRSKSDKTMSVAMKADKTESCEQVQRRSSRTRRNHNTQKIQETIDLSSDDEESVRRSKRKQASNDKNNGKLHDSKKESKDTTKPEKSKRKTDDGKNDNSQTAKKEQKETSTVEKEKPKDANENNEKFKSTRKKGKDSTTSRKDKRSNNEDRGEKSQSTRKGTKATIPLEKENGIKNDDKIESSKNIKKESKETIKPEQENRYSKRTRSKVSNRTNHEQDVSRSNTEKGPANLKRQASGDIYPANEKRTKSATVGAATPTRGIKTHRILFTAFPSETVRDKLEKFGGVIVNDVYSATVVLTLTIRRTFKLLCAIGLGKPIVGPNWVQACVDSGMIVDPWQYLMNDVASEKRFGFSLKKSLSCERNFLKGYNISCTPNVLPNSLEMQAIVECSGGTWREGGPNWYCVCCPADRELMPALRRRGAILVTNEFILGGVVRQRLLDKDKFLMK